MNKHEVNKMLPHAVELLKKHFKNGEIPNEYRGYISMFGAAVIMGSLTAAVAYHSDGDANTRGSRPALMNMILELLKHTYNEDRSLAVSNNLFDYVAGKEQKRDVRERVMNASIAIKLGMSLFKKTKSE